MLAFSSMKQSLLNCIARYVNFFNKRQLLKIYLVLDSFCISSGLIVKEMNLPAD